MSTQNDSDSIEKDLVKLEDACSQAGRGMSSSHSVRETMELAEVSVPHHLQSIARERVHSLSRLPRVRDMRVEEVVKNQLSSLTMERSESTASREYDRIKASDWSYLRSGYPDLYNKAVREGALIIERKRKAAR